MKESDLCAGHGFTPPTPLPYHIYIPVSSVCTKKITWIEEHWTPSECVEVKVVLTMVRYILELFIKIYPTVSNI